MCRMNKLRESETLGENSRNTVVDDRDGKGKCVMIFEICRIGILI